MSDVQIVAAKRNTHVISSQFPDARLRGKKRPQFLENRKNNNDRSILAKRKLLQQFTQKLREDFLTKKKRKREENKELRQIKKTTRNRSFKSLSKPDENVLLQWLVMRKVFRIILVNPFLEQVLSIFWPFFHIVFPVFLLIPNLLGPTHEQLPLQLGHVHRFLPEPAGHIPTEFLFAAIEVL